MKTDILNTALDQLIKHTTFEIKFNDNFNNLEINLNNQIHKWVIEFKNELTTNYLLRIQDFALTNNISNILIITNYANSKVREMAQKMGLNYLDATGNAFLKSDKIFIKIDGKQKYTEPDRLKNRAFTNTGLKILFYFLNNPDNVNKTIREIATETNTSLDTVHKTINALVQMKFLLKINNNYQLINTKDLLDRWIRDYDLKLKPKLFIGNFRFVRKEDQINWKTLQLNKEDTLWGGEAAAALITNYLQPGIFTLYTTANKNELAINYKLVPDSKGNIKVYSKFWKFNNQSNNTVPALLAYADLIITGDDRCIETAKLINSEFFANKY
jgi:hypothetical protein